MSGLSPAQLVEAMTGAERLCRWAQGVQLAAVKAFADYAVITDEDTRDDPLTGLPGGRQVVETGFGTQREIERFCSDGIGAALGTSFTAAQQLIDAAYFAAEVPRAAAMLAAGLIDVARLKVLARELAPVGYGTDEDRALVDALVERSAELTPKKLQVDARTAVMASRPDGQEEAHRREKRSSWGVGAPQAVGDGHAVRVSERGGGAGGVSGAERPGLAVARCRLRVRGRLCR